MDFFITDTEIALFAILGPIVGVVVGSWMTTRSQIKATRDSQKGQLELVRSQHESDELSRLSEKGGEATLAFISVLLKFPSLPYMIIQSWLAKNEEFLADFEKWARDFTIAAGPILVYGSSDLKTRLPDDVKQVREGAYYIHEALTGLIYRSKNDPTFSVIYSLAKLDGETTLVGAVKAYREISAMRDQLIEIIRTIYPMQLNR